MKRSAILFVVLSAMLDFGCERGFAQHTRGPAGGPSAGHGAPPTFSRPAEATPGTSSGGRTGKAIRDLRPDLSARQARADVHTAQRQAQRDMTADRLADQLAGNSELRVRLQSMLPAGTNLQAAAAGFNNEGQFIVAVHVSRNL